MPRIVGHDVALVGEWVSVHIAVDCGDVYEWIGVGFDLEHLLGAAELNHVRGHLDAILRQVTDMFSSGTTLH
jgi:hypothetical protein